MDTTHTLILPEEQMQVKYPLIIRLFASIISYIFHPLFIPIYVTYYLAFINPDYFIGFDEKFKWWLIIRTVVNMVFFPLLTVLLLKGVGFIDSIFLKTQRDRIIPYIAVGIFFFWMFLVYRNQPEIPAILTGFIFSVFISSSIALIANIYYKISMHAIGVGGWLGLMLLILFRNPSSPITMPLMLSVLISGIVCSSRMIVSNHTQKEIYLGLFFGIISQFIGGYFINS